jgi:hypothetical protein
MVQPALAYGRPTGYTAHPLAVALHVQIAPRGRERGPEGSLPPTVDGPTIGGIL